MGSEEEKRVSLISRQDKVLIFLFHLVMNWQDKVCTAQKKTCLKVEVVEGIEIKCDISNLSLQRFTRTRSTEKGWWEKEGDKEEEKEDKEDKEVMVDSSVGNQVR